LKTLTRVVCVAWAVAGCLYASPVRALEAGAAKIEIVPAPGTPLDGDFTRRGRPASGTRDPLFVRALFLQEGEVSLFLISADLFAITPDLRARVLERAPGVVPRENIVLVATHTLNGPGGLDHSWLGRQRGGRFMAEELDAVAAKFVEAMQAAYDRRTRASAGYAATETLLVANRFDPAAAIDGQLGVLRVDDSDGNPIALVANLGAALPGVGEAVFSADFPGAFCVALEGMTASPSVAMFLNGASGDQIPAATEGTQVFAEALAGRVKGLVNEIKCREVTLGFSSATQPTPIHSASPFYSDDAVFQVVEIDRLAMLFMSPIPRGATSLELRKATLARGYAQCMVVAPANGYVGAVARVESIAFAAGAEPVYLGPEASDWLVAGATAPLSRGDRAPGPEELMLKPNLPEESGVFHLTVSGAAAEIGAQRGAVLRQMSSEGLSLAMPGLWLESAAGGVLSHWELLRPAAVVDSLALPLASETARVALRSLGAETIEALAGMSSASGTPFGHLWLRQIAPSSDATTPAGPVAAAFAMQTDANGIVIGQSIEWPNSIQPIVTQVKPKSGHAYAVVGFPWQLGGLAGMNERGLAIAVATPRGGLNATMAVPAEAVMAEVLAHAGTFDEAVALFSVPRADLGGRVIVVFDDGNASQSALIEIGVSPTVFLNPVSADFVVDQNRLAPREARIQGLLIGSDAPVFADAERILTDRDRRAAEPDRLLNSQTRACVVLVPRLREMRVMAPEAGTPRAFDGVSLRGGES